MNGRLKREVEESNATGGFKRLSLEKIGMGSGCCKFNPIVEKSIDQQPIRFEM